MHAPSINAPWRMLCDAVNERAVRILLECILVLHTTIDKTKQLPSSRINGRYPLYKQGDDILRVWYLSVTVG